MWIKPKRTPQPNEARRPDEATAKKNGTRQNQAQGHRSSDGKAALHSRAETAVNTSRHFAGSCGEGQVFLMFFFFI